MPHGDLLGRIDPWGQLNEATATVATSGWRHPIKHACSHSTHGTAGPSVCKERINVSLAVVAVNLVLPVNLVTSRRPDVLQCGSAPINWL